MSLVSIIVTINLVLLLSFLETTIKILFRLLICFMYQSIAMVKSEGGFYLTTHFSLGKLAYQYFVHIPLLVNDKQPFLNQQKGSIDYEWFYVLFNFIQTKHNYLLPRLLNIWKPDILPRNINCYDVHVYMPQHQYLASYVYIITVYTSLYNILKDKISNL